MDVADDENPREVAVTQEPATLEPILEMQGPQEEDTVTQEPVSPEAMDVDAEESPKEVAVTQELATLIVNLDVLEDTVPQEPVLLPLRNFIDLDSDQEGHHKKEILNLAAEVSTQRMEVTK